MAALLSYVLLLLSAVAAHQLLTTVAAEPTNRGWSLAPTANYVAFMPRGGAIGFRKGKSTAAQASVNNDSLEINEDEQQTAEEDVDEELSSDETDDNTSDETTVSPFQKAYQEEVSEIKKSQEFLKKQQRRRELDKTWLDKGITAVIELFENIFRWEVID